MKLYTLLIITVCLLSQAACSDQSPESYFKKGLWAVNNDDINSAINNYKIAIELKPDFHEVRHRLAFILIEEKIFDEAKNHCDFLIKNKAFDYSPYYCLGVINFETKSYKDAVAYLEKQMQFDPGSAGVTRWLAKSYMKLGDYHSAESALKHQKHLENVDVEYNQLMGEILLKQKKDEEAKQFFLRAHELLKGSSQ